MSVYEPSSWGYDACTPFLELVSDLSEPMVDHATLPLPQIREQFHKTKMCKFFLDGTCARGATCSYAHSSTNLKESPDLAKTRLCQNFMNKKCFDPECPFAHGRHELRYTTGVYKTELCRWSAIGKCKDGATCRFAHKPEELRPCKTMTTLKHLT